jgi:hypothetical protein
VRAQPPPAGAAARAQASPVLRHTLELHKRGIHVSYEKGWPRTAGKYQRPQEPADSARDMDESCARPARFRSLARSVGERATGFAVCVIGAGRGGCLSWVGLARRSPRLRKTAVREDGAVVIDSYPALCVPSGWVAHGSGCNYSAPFRGHAFRFSAA